MKIFLPALALLLSLPAAAQTDSLSSGVYSVLTGKTAGRTTDLAMFKAHASTLAPGKTNHSPRALNDAEELILVKDGLLKIIINDSGKVLGPGSLALIMAGDVQSFQNTSDKPATYYVLTFKSPLPVNIQRGKQAGGSLMMDWNDIKPKKTEKGESRPIFDRPTSMFTRFEIHATTLNGGLESHPPHTHRAEEAMLVMQGTTAGSINGKDYPAGVGEILLLRPDILHNIKNTGTGQCWYYAMKWYN
ncbi:MAG TPA: cupin domain-containing protein [Chitinophagaceae bacterium]|nr:cupin domain-containing protein [Chitinophagaceae bacterium]